MNMAKGLLRTCVAGLTGLAVPAVGATLARKWKNTDGKQRAAYLAGGAAIAAWAVAGRWLLFPLLGAGKLSEPEASRGGSTQRVKRPDGTELQVEFYGPHDAPTLVLTHGWTQDSTGWYYLKRELSQRFRLIVWDLPGAGKSSRPSNQDYSLDKMARDLEAVVELAGRPVVLVGHSLGGMVIQSFCRLFPQHLGERITGLVLIDTTYTNPLETARFGALWRALQAPVFVPLWYTTIALSPVVWAMSWLSYFNGSSHLIKRLLGFAGRQTWRQVDFACRLTAKASPAVAARMSLASVKFNEWNTLSAISVPVLVLAGENDRVTRIDVNQQIQQRIPSARLVSFRPGGHYALFEHHEAVSMAVADFVESCRGSSSRSLASSDVDRAEDAEPETAGVQARH
jgi:pimeloyl-ACP methyl ester carboxylesterase